MHVVDDAEKHDAMRAWLDGGSALPLVRLHVAREEPHEAAAVARVALEQETCVDGAEIERILYQLDQAPADWDETLCTFALDPSVDGWRELMRFVPADVYYQRLRNSLRKLRLLGVDTNILFLCACELGMTPDAIALVEEGLVRSEVVEQRAATAGGAKATYYGLAGTAAYLAGDMIGAIRLLRESAAHQNEWCSPLPHVYFIRERGSAEDNALLDSAGIPLV